MEWREENMSKMHCGMRNIWKITLLTSYAADISFQLLINALFHAWREKEKLFSPHQWEYCIRSKKIKIKCELRKRRQIHCLVNFKIISKFTRSNQLLIIIIAKKLVIKHNSRKKNDFWLLTLFFLAINSWIFFFRLFMKKSAKYEELANL